MIRNIKLILCIIISVIVTCFLLTVIHEKVKEVQSAFSAEERLEGELKTYKNLKILLETQSTDKNLTRVENAVILQQSFINSMETGNASHVFPIPLNERQRLAIFSSWRSGSTFLGDIFNTLPGNYYHYEPFNFKGVVQLETNETHINYVKNLFKCQHEFTKAHMKYAVHWFFNKRLSRFCPWKNHPGFCTSINFRNHFCNIFPRQSMKLVRTRITLAEPLLEDPELNLNVILLVRDPRAVYLSREDLHGCNTNADCYSMIKYCEHLVEDYINVHILKEKYPSRIKVMRFEDLATNPQKVIKDTFNQFGIVYDEQIENFLNEHTKSRGEGTHSTYRTSEKIVARWMKTLSMNIVNNIQKECKEAMQLWGYKFIHNNKQLNSTVFDPLEDF